MEAGSGGDRDGGGGEDRTGRRDAASGDRPGFPGFEGSAAPPAPAHSGTRGSSAPQGRGGAGAGDPAPVPDSVRRDPREEVTTMAAVAQVLRHPARPPVVEARDPKEVVAVVLADGSVRDLREGSDRSSDGDWSTGSVTGPDWILWWERRSF